MVRRPGADQVLSAIAMSSRAPLIAELPLQPAAERALEVTNLRKTYRSPEGELRTIVDIAYFELRAQRQIALHGDSGCGKTTFLNLLAGIVRPDAGSVRLQDVEISALPESKRDRIRATTIGYVHQNFNLLQAFSALENVLLAMHLGAGQDIKRAKALLERVGLGERLTYRPKQLSTGQQQRVAVARALANRPKLVLADEPTGNLDKRSAMDVLGLLKEACAEQGAALLLVTHDSRVLDQFETVREFSKFSDSRRVAR